MKNSSNLLNYHCPRYEELTKIPMYMEQLIQTLDKYLQPFEVPGEEKTITATMVNNYVKHKIISPPTNKKYSESHIMYLIVIGILKSVLNISEIGMVIKMQIEQYPIQVAFGFFAIELENSLKVTFGTRDFAEANSEKEKTPLSKLVRSALLSFANKVYIKKSIDLDYQEYQEKLKAL